MVILVLWMNADGIVRRSVSGAWNVYARALQRFRIYSGRMQIVDVTQLTADGLAVEMTHFHTRLRLHIAQALRVGCFDASCLYGWDIVLAIARGAKPLPVENAGVVVWTDPVLGDVDVRNEWGAPVDHQLLQRMEQLLIVQVFDLDARVQLLWVSDCNDYRRHHRYAQNAVYKSFSRIFHPPDHFEN